MPLNTPEVFEFDEGFSQFVSAPTTLTVTDSGINFTWSVNVNGLAFASHGNTGTFHYLHATGSGSSFSAVLGLANATHQFVGGTFSSYKITLNIASMHTTGTMGTGWQIIGHTASGGSANFGPMISGANILGIGAPLTSISFHSTVGSVNKFKLLSINAEVNCFCAGTLIATPEGDKKVEDLQTGDLVTLANGGTTSVNWLGEQAIDGRLSNPKKVNPICISAGALGNDLPRRDLWVSQDHAIEIDGLLVNAGALVNGSTIYQVANMPLDGFSYYHIDTGAHELLLAEGVAAESFIDYASRDSFDGKGAATDMIPEMPLPRISSARMLPDAIKAKLRTATPKVA